LVDNKKIKIRLIFKGAEKPYLLDISSLLYDFELLHDLSLILYFEEYKGYKFNRYFWYRNGRSIKKDHQIRTLKIIKESPFTIELLISDIAIISGAFLAIVKAFDVISNWKLNREKLKLEIEKLKKDLKNYKIEKSALNLERRVHEKDAEEIYNHLIERLDKNPIKLDDIQVIELVED